MINASDELHRLASQLWRDVRDRFAGVVLTDLIIAEAGNSLARGPWRTHFLEAATRLLNDPDSTVVFVDEPLLEEAIDLYRSRSDKSWGLVDCVSFIVMRRLGIDDAFTSDRHFEQAGFSCMLSGS